jgi:DNA-binding CsgD family transcriptional regulator
LSANNYLEGWYPLRFQDSDATRVEFSVTANVLPGRHLCVLIPLDDSSVRPSHVAAGEREDFWAVAVPESEVRTSLTRREREVLSLVSLGNQNVDIAEALFLSQETVKSHVQNSMAKLGAHTRAHAVAIALVTGQIPWEPAR